MTMTGNTDAEMAEATPQPHELFHFAPLHHVLICIPCCYAIQPAAIARHLKEIHHIYRSKRRPFMDYASKLDLRRPEHVTPPGAQDFPVPYLAVEQGWKCYAPSCGHLCVSTKRMLAHWSLAHGRKAIENDDYGLTSVQTFFRGNLLRYFSGNTLNTKLSSQLVPGNLNDLNTLRIQRIQENHHLRPCEITILHHYLCSTHKTFAIDTQTEKIWLEVVPSLACTNSFLLHGILACTALHMAHGDPASRKEYTLQACAHQEYALPLFRNAINHPSEQSCDAVVAFAYMLVVYALATDNDNSLLLVDCGTALSATKQLDIPPWLHFIRAGCSMLCDVWENIETGPVGELAAALEAHLDVGFDRLPYLEHLLAMIPTDSSWTDDTIAVYRNSAVTLARSFAHVDGIKMESGKNTWHILSTWPVYVEDEYMDALYQHHPSALILLAYYCIILKQVEECWYFEDGAARLLMSILELLDTRWKPCINEAVARVVGLSDKSDGW
ncbi:hypothetical protein B0T10DRAFT_490535 [Thelonectria olida]|uniref:C2H2-type domain-containing protein n=1 Tax=Thelonectria olida TaxID=1576542 RepID=A0A9P8W3E8_9HYPO|nr:hypothetical protein B0T10DRAFT_490535 [Thelonectria olida]